MRRCSTISERLELDPDGRLNALVDALGSAKTHQETVDMLYHALRERVARRPLADQWATLHDGMREVVRPLAQDLARVLVEARDLGLPIDDRLRLLKALAACEPMPVSLVHGHGRNVPKRVRAVMAWIAQVIAPPLA